MTTDRKTMIISKLFGISHILALGGYFIHHWKPLKCSDILFSYVQLTECIEITVMHSILHPVRDRCLEFGALTECLSRKQEVVIRFGPWRPGWMLPGQSVSRVRSSTCVMVAGVFLKTFIVWLIGPLETHMQQIWLFIPRMFSWKVTQSQNHWPFLQKSMEYLTRCLIGWDCYAQLTFPPTKWAPFRKRLFQMHFRE